MFESVFSFIRSQYPGQKSLPLHAPRFSEREKELVCETINSTFVSSVGKFVEQLEDGICRLTGASHAIATVNGTSALHAALLVGGVTPGDEVITQPLTFVATANAISYCGAIPVFLDVDPSTLGLSASSLEDFCQREVIVKNGVSFNKLTGRRIAACVPMHTFGHPCEMDRIVEICQRYQIVVVEDAAESLGSSYRGRHTGTFGTLGAFSFNGNKIITGGAGGMIVTDDPALARLAKHLTTTAKLPHPWQYEHDMVGYNYRMPNLNAALLCAQLERLESFIIDKRKLAENYASFFATVPGISYIHEPSGARSNYWLHAILFTEKIHRDAFLAASHQQAIFCRPVWNLLHTLPMYQACQRDGLENASSLSDRLVNIPSSVRI